MTIVKIGIFTFLIVAIIIPSDQLILQQQQHISIRKPYQKQCDVIEPIKEELNIDFGDQNETNESCPKSDSIGCLCTKQELNLKCIYVNALDRIPKFTSAQNSSSQQKWNLGLKCKNLAQINDLSGLLPLKHIHNLDLSGYLTPDEASQHCKSTGTLSLVNLTKVGLNVYKEPVARTSTLIKHLEIDNLALDYNEIDQISLNKINLEYYAGGLASNLNEQYKYSFKIRNISLTHNRLADLNNIKYNLDLCYLELTRLNVAHNRIVLMDVSFLVYLHYLNASHNSLKSYSFYYFEESLPTQCNHVIWTNDSTESTTSG